MRNEVWTHLSLGKLSAEFLKLCLLTATCQRGELVFEDRAVKDRGLSALVESENRSGRRPRMSLRGANLAVVSFCLSSSILSTLYGSRLTRCACPK